MTCTHAVDLTEGNGEGSILHLYHHHMTEIHDEVPDRWLRIFVSAARAGSFTAAAADTGIGQSAVSHAMRRLEQALGTGLFHRGPGGVTLSTVGTQLYEHVQAGFEHIDQGVEAARGMARSTVTVSVSTSLATYWLLPRLAYFRQEHPDVELRCITNDTDRSIGRDGADLWVPLGPGPWPDGLVARHFCHEEIVPVAAPEVAAAWKRATPGRLLDAPLLHLEERYTPRFDWYRWFSHFGVHAPRRLAGSRTNDYSLVLQSAIDGQGIALGWSHLLGDLLEQNRLAQVGAAGVRTDHPFVVLSRARPNAGGPAADLCDWMVAQMSSSARR